MTDALEKLVAAVTKTAFAHGVNAAISVAERMIEKGWYVAHGREQDLTMMTGPDALRQFIALCRLCTGPPLDKPPPVCNDAGKEKADEKTDPIAAATARFVHWSEDKP